MCAVLQRQLYQHASRDADLCAAPSMAAACRGLHIRYWEKTTRILGISGACVSNVGEPRAWCRHAESKDIMSAAPMAHMWNAIQDAHHRRDAVNAQLTAASCMHAANDRSRKRGRESARNLTRRMVPQTVGGTVLLVRFGGR